LRVFFYRRMWKCDSHQTRLECALLLSLLRNEFSIRPLSLTASSSSNSNGGEKRETKREKSISLSPAVAALHRCRRHCSLLLMLPRPPPALSSPSGKDGGRRWLEGDRLSVRVEAARKRPLLLRKTRRAREKRERARDGTRERERERKKMKKKISTSTSYSSPPPSSLSLPPRFSDFV